MCLNAYPISARRPGDRKFCRRIRVVKTPFFREETAQCENSTILAVPFDTVSNIFGSGLAPLPMTRKARYSDGSLRPSAAAAAVISANVGGVIVLIKLTVMTIAPVTDNCTTACMTHLFMQICSGKLHCLTTLDVVPSITFGPYGNPSASLAAFASMLFYFVKLGKFTLALAYGEKLGNP